MVKLSARPSKGQGPARPVEDSKIVVSLKFLPEQAVQENSVTPSFASEGKAHAEPLKGWLPLMWMNLPRSEFEWLEKQLGGFSSVMSALVAARPLDRHQNIAGGLRQRRAWVVPALNLSLEAHFFDAMRALLPVRLEPFARPMFSVNRSHPQR